MSLLVKTLKKIYFQIILADNNKEKNVHLHVEVTL